MIVTTAGRTDEQMINLTKSIANSLGLLFVARNKRSVAELKQIYTSDVLVVGKNRYEYYSYLSDSPFFFHPNSAMFRVKRLLKNEQDTFIEATNLSRGKTMLDCTLGLASDSIVASYIVGEEGQVEGVEASKMIAFLVGTGLKTWSTELVELNAAMKRIKVKHANSIDELVKREENSVDCVYMDPMFEEAIPESNGINPLKNLAVYHDSFEEMMRHARRVAKDRVVLKDHFRSKRFEQFGFDVLKRKSAKFHYGVIIKPT